MLSELSLFEVKPTMQSNIRFREAWVRMGLRVHMHPRNLHMQACSQVLKTSVLKSQNIIL